MNRTELKRIEKWFGNKIKILNVDRKYKPINFNSLVLITSKKEHSSGYKYIEVYGYNQKRKTLYHLGNHDAIHFDCKTGIDSIAIGIIKVFTLGAFHFSGFPVNYCGMRIDEHRVIN